ncbi:MAG TPA: hypothetical protein VHZ51_05525 [Ktedonobacteraceae bacterium]|jgi:hypothetical protein|nr:hypothetical protein [Ktedonobacteraceae bacterium]
MPSTPRDVEPFHYTLHNEYPNPNEHTDPAMRSVTAPLPPMYQPPRATWSQRVSYGWSNFSRALVRKINQLLNLAMLVLILLLCARFLLTFFGVTDSLFAQWTFLLSWPLALPFEQIAPNIVYGAYHIDVSTLVAIAVYFVVRWLISAFLRLLVS